MRFESGARWAAQGAAAASLAFLIPLALLSDSPAFGARVPSVLDRVLQVMGGLGTIVFLPSFLSVLVLAEFSLRNRPTLAKWLLLALLALMTGFWLIVAGVCGYAFFAREALGEHLWVSCIGFAGVVSFIPVYAILRIRATFPASTNETAA